MYNTKTQVSESRSTQLRYHSTQRPKRFNVTKADLLLVGLCVVVAIYLLLKDTLLITVLSVFSIVFIGLWHLIHAVPILEKYLGAKIRFWQIAVLIITTTALLNTLVAPAHAIFLSGLEQFFVNLAQQTSQAGGATNTLDSNVVGLIFNLIRGVFLLLVAAAALFAYNQAQQGNDWRPIVTQVGLAFAIVIAIDVVTFIFVGNGTGTAGG
ncbi:MAG: hypothetical protein B0A82_08480 [Alkalinema sp. CACIAM 70d]|nr:MAG: hypothetical protein B0A82_08480 [Alkalinema sp. CACIAM 70d]